MPKKKLVAKKVFQNNNWIGLYKFALGAIVAMTIFATGAMAWQYWTFEASEWMFEDPEIDLIEYDKKEGLDKCGETDDTKGGCVAQKLSTPTSGASCQVTSESGLDARTAQCFADNPGEEQTIMGLFKTTTVSEKNCRARAAVIASTGAVTVWAQAMRTCSCQPGLVYDQRTITSDMLVDKENKTKKPKGYVNISGMHKCVPGLSGRLCPVGGKRLGKNTKWEPCYTVDLKGACKYEAEQPINIVSDGVKYKFCAPTHGQTMLEGANPCYTGSAEKPTVKLCCPAGKTVVSGKCQ